jgi:hypothetical protein
MEGTNLTRGIFEEGIANSHIVMAFWSKAALESKWVRYEIMLSTMLGKILIPVIMDEDAQRCLNLGFTDLSSLKYFLAYQCKDTNEMIYRLVGVVKEWHDKFVVYEHFQKYITQYSFGPVHDDYYEYGQKILEQEKHLIFKAGTPALLLKDEIYTPNRAEYLEKFLTIYSDCNSISKGIYLFDYRKTMQELSRTHREDLIMFTKSNLRRLELERIMLNGVKPRRFLSYLPSGMYGNKMGCLILKEPIRNDFVGLIFLKGKELDSVRTFYLNLLSKENIIQFEKWGKPYVI